MRKLDAAVYLQVGSRLDIGELVGQGVHGSALLQQLV